MNPGPTIYLAFFGDLLVGRSGYLQCFTFKILFYPFIFGAADGTQG
jgi:hypothetical protein